MKKTILLLTALLMIALSGCTNTTNETTREDTTSAIGEIAPETLFGSWVELVPGNESEKQGVILQADSIAVSINMATLITTKWWTDNSNLFLVQTSIGNEVSYTDTAVYKIESITNDKLVLKDGDLTISYTKE